MRTIEVKRKKPGRPPKYGHGTTTRHYRFPLDLVQKLRKAVEEGKFQSETEAIYHYVMYADKLDDLFNEIKKLKVRIEVLSAENEALRNKIKLLEEEKKALAEKYHELLKEHEETVNELLELKAKFSQSEGKEQDKVDWKEEVLELVKEYLKAKERETSARLQGERRDAFEEAQKLFRRIQSILEERNVNKTVFWRLVNKGDFDKVKQFLEGY